MISFDDAQMNKIVAAALLEQLTAEKKEELVQTAVQNILTERANPRDYNNKTTKLEEAFRQAVTRAAEQLAGEILKEPSNRALVEKLIRDAIASTFEPSESYDKLVLAMKYGLERALAGRDY